MKNDNIKNWKNKKANSKDSEKVKKDFWDYLKRAIGNISFVEEAIALYLLFTDPEYPAIKKGVAVFALIYFISPIDAIPDLIPIVGYLDDAGVIAAAINMYGNDIKTYREKAQEVMTANGFC